ncbi:hypothetical protein J2S13_002224 [Oikeobacillus pervagus]|uniref:Uncharacterized protein n=1 Tax=Oikeobacillus pervagus TaxID=1325931 RepID=A0AAJ1T014_9BACI|nr:hypothetical protein [Oikeobacillus pervagus]
MKLLASALSLFNVMVMVSRLANMMQQPFTGSLIDNAPNENALEFVASQYRILIGSATLGTIIGLLLLPIKVTVTPRIILLHDIVPRALFLDVAYLKIFKIRISFLQILTNTGLSQ